MTPAKWSAGIITALRDDTAVLLSAGMYSGVSIVYLWATGALALWRIDLAGVLPEVAQGLVVGLMLLWAFANRQLARLLTAERITGGLLVIVLYRLLQSVFFGVKQSLWVYIAPPNGWDAALSAADRFLHGGILPGVLISGCVSDSVIRMIDAWYVGVWGNALVVTMTVAAWSTRRVLRRQILLAYIGAWAIAGNLLAALCGSAGPCYLRSLTGDAAYAPLMDRLSVLNAQTPLIAVTLQQQLWERAGSTVWGWGISAMPSVHLALATITALYWARFGRVWGWCGVVFVASVQIGSVVLGWHYAIDGYAGIALGVLLWRGAGRLAERREARCS